MRIKKIVIDLGDDGIFCLGVDSNNRATVHDGTKKGILGVPSCATDILESAAVLLVGASELIDQNGLRRE